MTTQQLRARIRVLFAKIPQRTGWQSPRYPVAEWREVYRGKRRYVVGYSHSRLYSHHFNGLVYDRVLGYGDSPEAAVAMMERKLGVVRGEEPR